MCKNNELIPLGECKIVVFYSLIGFFSFQNLIKHFFLNRFALKKLLLKISKFKQIFPAICL